MKSSGMHIHTFKSRTGAQHNLSYTPAFISLLFQPILRNLSSFECVSPKAVSPGVLGLVSFQVISSKQRMHDLHRHLDGSNGQAERPATGALYTEILLPNQFVSFQAILKMLLPSILFWNFLVIFHPLDTYISQPAIPFPISISFLLSCNVGSSVNSQFCHLLVKYLRKIA